MGIRQQFIAPYTPKENLKGKDQRNWDEKWPGDYASSEHEHIGIHYPPSFLTQGRKPRLPSALYDRETLGT